jgi:hypothetical protein
MLTTLIKNKVNRPDAAKQVLTRQDFLIFIYFFVI